MSARLPTVFVCMLTLMAPALSQSPQPDVAALQKAVGVLQGQRNNAMDALANVETRAALMVDEIAKLKAKVDDLEKKAAGSAVAK